MKVLLVGAGGYASNYVNILLDPQQSALTLEGIVDPFYALCKDKAQIDAARIPVYDTMEEFYSRHTAELAIVCTPTFLHCEQSICALSNGSNVLCEKPAAPTVKEAEEMLNAEEKYGRFIAIGYQWSYSDAIQSLKSDILSGVLGKPLAFKTAISWPRNRAYYQRGGGWGGCIQKSGRLILDSIASNACAHYLHNMLFLLGDTMQTSAGPTDFLSECFRANEIENFDTCCIKMKTQHGAELYFAATHAAQKTRNPEFEYAFEKARVFYSQDEGSQIIAHFHDGSIKVYGDPFANNFQKLWACVDAAKNGTTPVCTVKTAIAHVKLIEDIYNTTPIRDFNKGCVHVDPEKDAVYVQGLFEAFWDAYQKEELFTESASRLFEG